MLTGGHFLPPSPAAGRQLPLVPGPALFDNVPMCVFRILGLFVDKDILSPELTICVDPLVSIVYGHGHMPLTK